MTISAGVLGESSRIEESYAEQKYAEQKEVNNAAAHGCILFFQKQEQADDKAGGATDV